MTSSIPCQVEHHRDELVVTVDVPGARAEDLRIAFSREELTIVERSASGTRTCVLPLSWPIDERRATMRLSGGVLSLHLPTLARDDDGR